MCSPYVLNFGIDNLAEAEIKGKKVLEVGAYNVNGSLRDHVTRYKPFAYIGVDLKAGPGVDSVMSADDLLKHYKPESFDLVISTEMLEHVENWKLIVSNMKRLVKPGGILLITTRSDGFPFHEYPIDAWRFELDDMRVIFSDMEVITLIPDPFEPGVFIKCRKPAKGFKEADLSSYELYSIPKAARVA